MLYRYEKFYKKKRKNTFNKALAVHLEKPRLTDFSASDRGLGISTAI
jgi:hypothetical protein